MDRETIERCAKAIALEARAKWPQDANRYRRFAKAGLSAVSDQTASHAIITKLIGYAGHDDACDVMLGARDVCDCGYSETLAEARKFMEGGDE